MRERTDHTLKLIIPAQRANPAPPIGPALGQKGVNTKLFCGSFNELTKTIEPGTILSAKVTIKRDKTFTIVLRGTPTALLIKQHTISSPNGKCLTHESAADIAKTKLPTLNTRDLRKAVSIIAGCAKSMNVKITDPLR